MRYPASEKLEIIRIVEQSHLPAKRTLDQLGIARRTSRVASVTNDRSDRRLAFSARTDVGITEVSSGSGVVNPIVFREDGHVG